MSFLFLVFVSFIFCENVFDIDYELASSGGYKCELREGEELYEGECMLCMTLSKENVNWEEYTWTCLIRLGVSYFDEEEEVQYNDVDTLLLMIRKRTAENTESEGMTDEEVEALEKVILEGSGKFSKPLYFPLPEEKDEEFKLSIDRCRLLIKNAETDEVADDATDIIVGLVGDIPEDYNECFMSVCEYGRGIYYEGWRLRTCETYDKEVYDPFAVCTAKDLPQNEDFDIECITNLDTLLTDADFE